MAWQPSKPANNDLVFNSVGSTAIRGNFEAIDTAWDINHVGIDDTNEGKHGPIHIIETSEPTTGTSEAALYLYDTSLTLNYGELFFKRDSRSGENAYPITAAERDTSGWTYLPSGILLKWGTASGTGSVGYFFPTGSTYPEFSEIYHVFCTVVNNGSGDTNEAVRIQWMSTTAFQFYTSSRSSTGSKAATFSWLAIGLGDL